MNLPLNFSPTQALKQVGDWAGVYGDDSNAGDYDIFGDVSVNGGARDASSGIIVGGQGTLNPGWVLGSNTAATYQPTQNNSASNNKTTPTGTGTSTTGTTRTSLPQQEDPYAKFGGKEAYDNKVNEVNVTQQGYKSGAQTTLGDVKNKYSTDTDTFLTGIEGEQGDINRGSAKNQLNLRQSINNIVRDIQTGLRSAGVMLGNYNASDSGATDAIAKAYAGAGNRQSGEARGAANDVFEEYQKAQGLLNTKREKGKTDLDTWGDTEVKRVQSDFTNKLNVLDADAKTKGLPGADKSMVGAVVADAIAQLAEINTSRDTRLAGIKQWTPDETMQEAIRLENAGQAGTAFSTQDPNVQWGGNGQAMSGARLTQMPLYVKNKDQLATVPSSKSKNK